MQGRRKVAKSGAVKAVAGNYISMNELASRLTISRATVYRWIEIGLLPHPIKLGPSRVGFLESEIVAFQASRPRALGGALPKAA
jgi:prophage regulatory protein